MEKTNREKEVSGQANPDDKKEINDYAREAKDA